MPAKLPREDYGVARLAVDHRLLDPGTRSVNLSSARQCALGGFLLNAHRLLENAIRHPTSMPIPRTANIS